MGEELNKDRLKEIAKKTTNDELKKSIQEKLTTKEVKK